MKYPYELRTRQALDSITQSPQHAYILHGPKGSGKHLAALELAAVLLNEPRVAHNTEFAHSNVYIVRPLDNKQNISIAQIRELNEKIWVTNTDSQHPKVIIISGAEQISLEASNALLKNLEDTPDNTVFLLITDKIDQIIPTIRSRSQLVHFKPIELSDAQEYLQTQHDVTSQEAEELIQLAHGSLAQAIELLNNQLRDKVRLMRSKAQEFYTGSVTQKFIIAKNIHTDNSTEQFLEELIYTSRQQSTILSMVAILDNLMLADQQIKANVNTRTVLENLGLQMAKAGDKVL